MVFIRTLVNFLQDPEYRDLLGTTLFILFLGTMVYHQLEGWGYLDSLYFSIITLTTVGYGDIVPLTSIGKILSAVIAIIGIGFVALPTGIISSSFIERIRNTDSRVCPHCGESL